MRLEILMSCMGQIDDRLVQKSGITGDAVVINQCNRSSYREYATAAGKTRMFNVPDRGLCKSRNQAIAAATADICLLCDDDEVFVPGYESVILGAYEKLAKADLIIFKMTNYHTALSERIHRLRFPQTMKVCSWQISFRRQSILRAGIWFDERMGAGSGNGAEEELKFLLDCQRAGLRIYYVPEEIASVAQVVSTWRHGYDEGFFERRGTTTRYVLGPVLSRIYAVYYVAAKRKLYCDTISPWGALKATLHGIHENRLGKQQKQEKEQVL